MPDTTEVLPIKDGEEKKSESRSNDSQPLQTESENLRKNTTVSDSTIDTSEDVVPPLDIVKEIKPVNDDQKTNLKFIQEQIKKTFAIAQPSPEGIEGDKFTEHVKKGIEAIEEEQKKGVFGPKTQEAYKNLVNWMQDQAIPGAVKELDTLKEHSEPGNPLELPTDKYGRVISVDLYKALVRAKRLKPDLKIDTTKIPNIDEAEKLSDSMKWIKDSSDTARTVRLQQQDRQIEADLKNIITDPEQLKNFLDRKGSDPEKWRRAAVKVIDLATRTKNYVEAMDSLHRAGKRFKLVLPPGAEVERDDKNRVKHVKLDLPKDLKLSHPRVADKITKLETWMSDHGTEIDQAMRELVALEKNPDRLLFMGEVPMPTSPLKLDAKGNVEGFVDPKKVDGSESYVNLAFLNFEANEVTVDGEKKIAVSNTVQYHNSKWYNYLNIGAEDVGNEIKVGQEDDPNKPRLYDPEDWVAIKAGDKVEVMKAKDLASWKRRRQLFHYGEKALVATLDASMLVTGTIAVGGAVKAAQAGRLVVSQAIKQGAKGLGRAALGGSGIVSNAYWSNTEIGRNIQTGRGFAFVGMAGVDVVGGGIRFFRGLKGGTEVLSAGQKAHKIVEAQIEASKWANRIYKPSEFLAGATMYPFAGIIGMDIYHQVDSLDEIGRVDPTKAAMRQAKDGRGDHEPQVVKPFVMDSDKVKVAELDRYNALLQADTPNQEVKEIVEKTRKLIEDKATDKEKEAYKQKLMDKFMPNAKDIVKAEKAGTFHSDKSARHLNYQEKQDRSVQLAAALAILQLSRKDGKYPETLAERKVDVPEYDYTVSEFDPHSGTSYDVTKTRKAREESQDLKTSDITAFLRRELVDPKQESRLVASGDLALQLGVANGREVAGVLQDVITSKSSTQLEKTEAVLRLGVTLDALKNVEAAPPKEGSDNLSAEEQAKRKAKDDEMTFGLDSKAITHYLKNLTEKGESKEIRAAAGLMLFANGESDSKSRQDLMRSYAKMLGENADNPAEFAKKAIETLTTEMNKEDSPASRRLNAANSLLDLIKGDGNELGKEFKGKENTPEYKTALEKHQQRKVAPYEALAKVVDNSNVALSTKAVRRLIPEGLDLISKESAGNVRIEAVEIMQDTLKAVKDYNLTSESESERVEFISLLKPLIKDGTQRQKSSIQNDLISLFDQSVDNNYFADFSPELRKAAIKSIADMGSRGGLQKLREAVVGDFEGAKALDTKKEELAKKKKAGASADEIEELEKEIKDQEEGLIAKDWDASVRYQALKALDHLKDPKLRSVVMSALYKETDPSVSMLLHDVRFTTDRIDPSSEEYKKEFEKTAANLLQDPLDGWDTIKAEIEAFKRTLPKHKQDEASKLYIRKWMTDNYWLLDGTSYNDYRSSEGQKAADKVYSGFTGGIDHFFSSRKTINYWEREARVKRQNEIFKSRGRQFDNLIKKASLTNADGMKAKMALADVLLNGGQPFSSKDSTWAQQKAASAFFDLSKSGVENRDYVNYVVKSGLTTSRAMDQQSRRILFNAMTKNLAKPNSKGDLGISKEEIATTAALALKLQHTQKGTYSPDNDLQIALMSTIVRNGHHKIYPVFEAMAEHSSNDKVKQYASYALAKMRDSVIQVRTDTAPDTTSTLAQRALNIQEAMKDENNSQQVIEAIYAACKGKYISKENYNDPRVPVLKMAMKSTNPRVRLAAAGSYLEISKNYPTRELDEAVKVLTDIRNNSQVKGYKNDAATFLAWGVEVGLLKLVKNK